MISPFFFNNSFFNKRFLKTVFFTFLSSLFFVPYGLAKTPLNETSSLNSIANSTSIPNTNNVTMDIQYLSTEVKNINDFTNPAIILQWIPVKTSSIYLKQSSKSSWIKVTLTNPLPQSIDRLLELATTEIKTANFYELQQTPEGSNLRSLYANLGMSQIFRDRPINYRNIVYPIDLQANSSKVFLINIAHDHELKINISLWNKKQFYENATKELVFFGMIYGVILMIAIYNLFIYLSLREKSHLLFVLFSALTGVFISILEGHFYQFLGTNTIWKKDIIYAALLALMCFFFALFSQRFLDITRWSTWLDKLLLGVGSTISLALIFLGMTDEPLIYSNYSLLFIIALYSLGIIIGLFIWHRNVASAGFYTLAIFLSTLGLLMEFTSHLAFMPWAKLPYSFASIGNTAMILVFAFAIADKMRQLQKEKLSTGNELVKLIEENSQGNLEIYKTKLHELQLEKEADLAKIESRAKSEFLATMSHEIRTPMNGVLGMAELLNDTDLDKKQKHYAVSISNSAKALLNAINDLLDYTKIESGKMEFESRLFNLEKIIDDCIGIFALRAAESKVNFIGQVQPGTPLQFKGDAEKIRQVLLNLIGNSFNFSNKNDILINAYATGKTSVNSIEIRFDITTFGMILSNDDKDSLFSTEPDLNSNQRKHHGHELGLTVSRQLVELMQGHIGVDTNDNSTTLWFTSRFILPRNNEEKELPDRTKILSGRKLLICESQPAFINSIQVLTESWGMNTTATQTSKEAINILFSDDQSFQVMMIEEELLTPEVQLAIRQSNVNHNFITSIILMTRTRFALSNEEMKKQGIQYILETPYTTSQLYKALQKSMGIESEVKPSIEPETLSVLIAEDNNVNLMVIEGILKKLKIFPATAADGQKALNIFTERSDSFDLIFMDCEMPELDGYSATAKIREFEKEKNLTPCIIIGLSGHSTSDYKDRALLSGMNDFLVKPINTDDISNILERVRSGFFSNPVNN